MPQSPSLTGWTKRRWCGAPILVSGAEQRQFGILEPQSQHMGSCRGSGVWIQACGSESA